MAGMAIDADGRFAGYASLFGKLDAGGDIVMPGAFAASLSQREVRMLFQHDPKEPVGIWEKLVEDGHGLRVEGRLIAGVPRAEALGRLIAANAIDGLSIGFRTIRANREPGTGHRRLYQIDLWEVSIVAFPMLEGARIAPAPPPVPASQQRLLRSLDAAITALRQPQ